MATRAGNGRCLTQTGPTRRDAGAPAKRSAATALGCVGNCVPQERDCSSIAGPDSHPTPPFATLEGAPNATSEPMDESDLEVFRTRFRLRLLEQLVLKVSFAFYIKQAGLSAQQTETMLKGYLDDTSALADRVYGAALEDPGLTALFADEAKAVVEAMKKSVTDMAVEARKTFGA
jgi:hypothetical protein